jgi:DNA-3-methyladenine glycosylase II
MREARSMLFPSGPASSFSRMLSPSLRRRALAHLRASDPRLAAVMTQVGRCRYRVQTDGTHFEAVCRSIMYQQLSGRAASTIHARVRAIYGDRDPTPAELLATPDAILRAAGVSRQKLSYLRDLSARVASGELPIETVHELDDAGVIAALTSVKGVGVWTAQIFLMYRLGRPDVLPGLDLGVRKAIQKAYRLRALPPPERVDRIGRPWAPYRSIAAWYLWRSLDPVNGPDF